MAPSLDPLHRISRAWFWVQFLSKWCRGFDPPKTDTHPLVSCQFSTPFALRTSRGMLLEDDISPRGTPRVDRKLAVLDGRFHIFA
ncbi:hypothetical protein EVAR_57013_1 [Eumeta japonica]|uniref:Uncharacterized protein n=1 Tax=Eumeta variegata TaxID=151549 RepID=A0A4C2A680_EUMVA|nr:hypothetical protein EVAR_57013_1 [Eumeta japonica]